jgi:hypothetical protein
MASTKCSYCGKETEESVRACLGCGTSLEIPRNVDYPWVAREETLSGALKVAGGLVVIVGFAAGSAHDLFVGIHIIVAGLALFVAGLVDSKKTERQLKSDAALEHQFQTAVSLEVIGDLEAALAIYRDLASKHPDTRVGRNAKNAIVSMLESRARVSRLAEG